jgi:hypothetical protein
MLTRLIVLTIAQCLLKTLLKYIKIFKNYNHTAMKQKKLRRCKKMLVLRPDICVGGESLLWWGRVTIIFTNINFIKSIQIFVAFINWSLFNLLTQ